MALTGSLTGKSCYATAASASDVYFSNIAPVVLSTGNTVNYQKTGTVWYRVEVKNTGVLASSSVAPVPSFATCDPLSGWSDGLIFGGLLLAAIVAAVAAGIVSKAKG